MSDKNTKPTPNVTISKQTNSVKPKVTATVQTRDNGANKK